MNELILSVHALTGAGLVPPRHRTPIKRLWMNGKVMLDVSTVGIGSQNIVVAGNTNNIKNVVF